MTVNLRRYLVILLTGIGITLILTGLVPVVLAQTEEPAVTSEPAAETTLAEETPVATAEADAFIPTGNNSYCGVCHSQPWRTVSLTDGYILNLYVPTETIHNSVHDGFGCIDCHGEDAFPHDKATPLDRRSFALNSVKMCETCHEDQTGDLEQGLHALAIAEGNTAAAVCTDCHGAHDVQPGARQPQLVAGVCGDCHVAALAEWRESPHVDIGPLGCATCHNPHAQTLRTGTTGDELCQKCHTTMEDLWVHTQHLGAVVNAEQQVGCVDCHMYVSEPSANVADTNGAAQNVALIMPHSTGHSMIVETVPCITCHTNLAIDQTVSTTPDETPGEVVDPHNADTTAEETSQDSLIELLQGLILGLGFGATGAAVFVSRGNRKS